jgi:hypothetical protein
MLAEVHYMLLFYYDQYLCRIVSGYLFKLVLNNNKLGDRQWLFYAQNVRNLQHVKKNKVGNSRCFFLVLNHPNIQ